MDLRVTALNCCHNNRSRIFVTLSFCSSSHCELFFSLLTEYCKGYETDINKLHHNSPFGSRPGYNLISVDAGVASQQSSASLYSEPFKIRGSSKYPSRVIVIQYISWRSYFGYCKKAVRPLFGVGPPNPDLIGWKWRCVMSVWINATWRCKILMKRRTC